VIYCRERASVRTFGASCSSALTKPGCAGHVLIKSSH